MISVILNVYKRPDSLDKQIEAIKNQSIRVKSEDIHVWYNTPENGIEQLLPTDKDVKTYQCNYNTKFFGRFTLPLLCKTPYVAMFDDDTLPGVDWFKNCLETIEKHNGILGSAGVVTGGRSYIPNMKYGWNGQQLDRAVEVDLVGHAWFFRQEWAKFIWMGQPPSWDNGEDMFFSYMAQKNGVNTYVPPHPVNNKDLWGNNPDFGHKWAIDDNATYRTVKNHYQLRNSIVGTLYNKGWKTIRTRR